MKVNGTIQKTATAFLFVVLLGAGALALDWWRIVDQEQAAAFFAAALKEQNISATVVINDVSYAVKNGEVESIGKERFDALRTAYALVLAQRSPLLAIPGTDPAALEEVTKKLQRVAEGLSALQKSAEDTEAVRTALYPVDFLYSLAALERARQAFIATSSGANYRSYEQIGRETVLAYEKDMRAHKAALTRTIPEAAVAYQVFEGTITRESMLTSMDTLLRGMRETSTALEKQRTCVSGTVSSCDVSRLRLPGQTPADTPSAETGTKKPLAFLSEIQSSYARTTRKDSYPTGPTIEIARSVCLDNLDVPPLFSFHKIRGVDTSLKVEFVGDLLFVPTELYKNIPYYRYFLDNNVAYVYFPIWEHYKCPGIGLDTAHIFGTMNIWDAAQTEQFSRYAAEPDAATLRKLEERLIDPPSGVVYEGDAKKYIDLAMRTLAAQPDTPPHILNTLLDLSLAEKYGTTRFDKYISRLTNDETVNMGLMRANIPVELGAAYLFYVRSGFFSLFLGANPSVAGIQGPPVEKTVGSPKFPFVRYTELRATVSQAELVKDMTFFVQIHENISKEIIPQVTTEAEKSEL